MSILEVVSMSALATVVRRKGRRHPKRPHHWNSSTFSSHNSGWSAPARVWRGGRWVDRDRGYEVVDKVPDGNLEHELYRFWIGMPEKEAKWSKCRFCGEVCMSKEARRIHQEKPTGHCCSNLVKIYKIALEPPSLLCVVCGRMCYAKKLWGVPLCDPPNSTCVRSWKFCPNMSYHWEQLCKKALSRGVLTK